MVCQESDPRFVVGPSTLRDAGQGLFARLPLQAGARLEAVGVLVPSGSPADTCTAFADAYKFRVGDLLLIPVGYAALVNHAPQPNLEKVVEGDRVFLRTVRDIRPGEELFFTYSAYAQERWGLR